MKQSPIPLRECVNQWRAYKASAEGKPIPEVKEPPPQEVYEGFGRAVAQEMTEDPVSFRLVMGKLGARLIGPDGR
jgi:hypothetical protein